MASVDFHGQIGVQVWMLETGLPGENLSFNTQIKTDTVRILAEGQIHSSPRGAAAKPWGKMPPWRGEGGSEAKELSVGSPRFLQNYSSSQSKRRAQPEPG